MKAFATFLAVAATLSGSAAYAAQPAGRGAAASRDSANDSFAWGIGLGALAVLGIVIGLTAAAAADNPSSFSHG